ALARIAVERRELAVGEEAREAHVPRREVAPRALRGLARAVRARIAGHEHNALRAEALESLARLARARHDCFVVTELAAVSPLEDDEPLGSLEPDGSALEDPEPDDVPVDSELEDPELLDVEPVDASPALELVPDPLVEVDSDFSAAAFAFSAAALRAVADCEALVFFAPLPATTACALRLADALSAGSSPDASCT